MMSFGSTILGLVVVVFTLIGFARIIWWEAKRTMQSDCEELARALLQARASSRHWQRQAHTYSHTARVARTTTEKLLELVESQRLASRPATSTRSLHAVGRYRSGQRL